MTPAMSVLHPPDIVDVIYFLIVGVVLHGVRYYST